MRGLSESWYGQNTKQRADEQVSHCRARLTKVKPLDKPQTGKRQLEINHQLQAELYWVAHILNTVTFYSQTYVSFDSCSLARPLVYSARCDG